MAGRTVTLKGNPVEIVGPELKVGDRAPDFKLQDSGLAEKSLADYAGKTKIILTVPSLDTSVCSMETKKFNDLAAQNTNWVVLCVSMDLPFGQKRWCGAENVTNVHCLSGHRDTKFGESYGVLISGGGLDRCLARAVFVVDGNNTIKYVEYVPEIASEPNYEAASKAT